MTIKGPFQLKMFCYSITVTDLIKYFLHEQIRFFSLSEKFLLL